MKTGFKILLGSVLGFLAASLVSSTYFYNSFRRVMRGLRESIKDYNY